ncbi:MAG: cell division protein FtsX [Patescibacteria group bacterium]
MYLLSLYRIGKFALQNFGRNIWLSIVTITIIVMSLFVMTMLVALNVVVQDTIGGLQKKIDISVYFNPTTTAADVAVIKDNITQLEFVTSVVLVTREEALENFKARYEENSIISRSLDELESNPLGDILVIQTATVDDYKKVLAVLSQEELQQYIQSSDFSDFDTIITRISEVSEKINQIGGVVSLIFIFVMVLVVFNTIRMAIYTHKEEISIMRLVGASGRFIRAPFLLEGLLYALIAVLIVIGTLFPILDAVQPFVGSFFGEGSLDLSLYFRNNFWQVFGLEFVLIALLNIFSTTLALQKYIKV